MLYFSTSPNQCFCTTLQNGKHGNVSFHVLVAWLFANRHTSHIEIITQGRLHKGEWCEMHHGKNGGGNVVMIMMLLLVSIIIYYYMNTFITLHQCTFNLLFALFVHCVSKKSPMFSAITHENIVGFS